MQDSKYLEIVKDAVDAIPAANAARLLEKVQESIPDATLDQVTGLATMLVLSREIQAHGPLESRRYYPAGLEVRAEDLAPGTGFEVVVKDDGSFVVRFYYDWESRDMFDGEGVGATFAQAATMAIRDAEGELELEDDRS